MKKIFLSILFVVFSTSINAQNIVDRQTIKNNSNNLIEFVDEDLIILKNNLEGINESHEKELKNVLYEKYKVLTTELSKNDLFELIDSTNEKIRIVFGNELYSKLVENQKVLDRITGSVYLPK